MSWRVNTNESTPGTEGTREDALAWARGMVAKGIRVVRLRSGKTRRGDRPAVLAAPRFETQSFDAQT